MSELLVEIDERNFDDFEQFAVLFLLEKSDLDQFVDFAPKYWFPVASESDRMGGFIVRIILLFLRKAHNLTNNIPHHIEVPTFIKLPIMFLLASVPIVLDRVNVLFVLVGVVVKLYVGRSVLGFF